MSFRGVSLLLALSFAALGASAQTADVSAAAPAAASASAAPGSSKFVTAQQKATQRIEKRIAKLEKAKACVAEAQTMKALKACLPKEKDKQKEKAAKPASQSNG